MYFYSGMADIAAETHDRDYQSAVISLWDNMVNKKYYLTGGIGSGETSEGFGPNYSLRNEAYCETCSSCGVVFFQYKLNLAYHDAKYADLYEQTMYNALLGGVALDGQSFCYTNPLVNTERAMACVSMLRRQCLAYVAHGSNLDLREGQDRTLRQHVCRQPNSCRPGRRHQCRGDPEDRIPVEGVGLNHCESGGGKDLFSLRSHARSDHEQALQGEPRVRGVKRFAVNGQEQTPIIQKGYAVVTREWKAGDRIELEFPMEPQRVAADDRIKADADLVALQYGPLVYNVETADNRTSSEAGRCSAPDEWRPDLLGGVMVITGKWADGSPMLAIPNFARMNRVGPPNAYPGEKNVEPGAGHPPEIGSSVDSKVWI